MTSLTQTEQGTQLSICKKKKFFLKARVALERETGSLGENNGMFLLENVSLSSGISINTYLDGVQM